MKQDPNSIQFLFPYKNKVLAGKKILEAKIFYRDYIEDLLSGELILADGIESLNSELSFSIKRSSQTFKVVHLFYEYTEMIKKDATDILGILLDFESIEEVYLDSFQHFDFKKNECFKESDYFEMFNKGKEFLQRGDCYQYNLTIPFQLEFNKTVSFKELLSNIWQSPQHRGPYAHATYLPQIKKSFISNSPECLFQVTHQDKYSTITSMPIKGSLSTDALDSDRSFIELSRCEKNESELYMITDLLKNDLSLLDIGGVEITALKAPLKVPGLIHQYSKIELKTKKNLTLLQIIKALFPCGSITGAPKKRVVEIIAGLEQRKRGLYCGSTILCFRDFLASSVNIRTAEFEHDFNRLVYQAGGGVTLLSEAESELNEARMKFDSFFRLI